MSSRLRRILLCLLIGGLAILAHAPLAGSGYVGGDLALLAEAADGVERGATPFPSWLANGGVRPVPTALLHAQQALQPGTSALEPGFALPLRLLALAALILAAAGAGVTLRRFLVPWLGESAARAAGWAAAGLAVAHPATVAAVARPSALGDLLALAAGTWCAAFFLRGRQERKAAFLAVAAALAIAAGFASRVAWLLPPLAAGLEFASAHRPRPMAQRLASAFAVAFVAVLCAAIEPAVAWPQHLSGRWYSGYASSPGAGERALVAIESLGVLTLPAPSSEGPGVFVIAGALLLLAAEPLLRAVRSAPRLWGWLALGWLALLAVALGIVSDLRVPAGQVELAQSLAPASLVVCAGLAAAATALGGGRRTLLPIAIAGGLCWIADRTAQLWPAATRELIVLRGDLERAQVLAGEQGTVLAVGIEYDARGFGPREPGELSLVRGRSRDVRVQSTSLGALPYALRLPAATAARETGLAVLLPADVAGVRDAVRIEPARTDARALSWRHEGRSDELEVDPLQLTAVRVVPRPMTPTSEPPRMGWRTSRKGAERGEIEGAWIESEDGPVAVFDLALSVDWLLGGTIRKIWFENQLRTIATAEIRPELNLAGVVTLSGNLPDSGSGTIAEVPLSIQPRTLHGTAQWTLLWCDGDWAEWLRPVRGVPLDEDSWFFPVDPSVGPCAGRKRATILECRVEDAVVARVRSWPEPGR